MKSSSIFICKGWWEFKIIYMSWVEIEDSRVFPSSCNAKYQSCSLLQYLLKVGNTLSDLVMFLMCLPNFPKLFFIFKETSFRACKASSEWVNVLSGFKMLGKDGLLECCIT